MGKGSEYLDDGTEKNIEALEMAKQSSSNVESISNKTSQVAQISTSKSN